MGVDDGLVQEIIGHSSSLMVEHYRHASLTKASSAMRRMEQLLGLKGNRMGSNTCSASIKDSASPHLYLPPIRDKVAAFQKNSSKDDGQHAPRTVHLEM